MPCSSRVFVLSIFALLLLLPSAVCAAMITGRVATEIDRQNIFVLEQEDGAKIAVQADFSPLPRRLHRGRIIRVWGTYSADKTSFMATDIRGPGNTNRHDPTGVRSRIGRDPACRRAMACTAGRRNKGGRQPTHPCPAAAAQTAGNTSP